MPTIYTGVRPVFTFADEGLIEYEKVAAKRLGDILERLDLGEPANLQLESSTFLPDNIARISFKVMEGILEPIIVVDISRQDPRLSLRDVERDLEELPEEETRFYYSPAFWVGITTTNHTKTFIGENPNCGYFGFPPQACLWAFEPPSGEDVFGNPLGGGGDEYGYLNTVEHLPGLTSACGLPPWTQGKSGDASINRQLQVMSNTSYSHGSNLSDEGYFGDQNFQLYESIVRSESGMTAFEGLGCYATRPPEADLPWGQNGQPDTEAGAALPANYWLRSVLVASSFEFRGGGGSFSAEVPCIVTGDGPGGSEDAISMTNSMPEGTVFNQVLNGTYEINAFATMFECECIDSTVRMRIVLGETLTEIESLNDETTGIRYQALKTVVDFEVDGIGNTFTCQHQLCRDFALGGHGDCDEFQDRGPLDSNGRGIWSRALFLNPFASQYSIGFPTFRAPFFNTGGGGCAQSTRDLANDPNCQACGALSLYVSPQTGFGHPNSGINCIQAGNNLGTAPTTDTRTAIGFQLARVVSVEDPDGRLCHVQIVGNEGGQGQCGPTSSYAYGSVFFAAGAAEHVYPGSGPLPDDWEQPTGWKLGQLVVVYGLVNRICDSSGCQSGPDPNYLLVGRTTTPLDNFLNEFWAGIRCADGQGFQNLVQHIETVSLVATACLPGGKEEVTPLRYFDHGSFGGFVKA